MSVVTRKKVNRSRFAVVVTCQGQSFLYECRTLVGALLMYARQYLEKREYGTMNFQLIQWRGENK